MVHCLGEAVERRFALHVTPAEAFEIRGGEFVVGDFRIAHGIFFTGTSGTSGTSGISGISGTSGTSGTN